MSLQKEQRAIGLARCRRRAFLTRCVERFVSQTLAISLGTFKNCNVTISLTSRNEDEKRLRSKTPLELLIFFKAHTHIVAAFQWKITLSGAVGLEEELG